jgi:hypothetical protein
MTAISWLHLADLHWTLRRPGLSAPEIDAAVRDELWRLHDQNGPFDLVVVAGDLAWRGAREEMEDAAAAIEDMFAGLGSQPALVVVPGNHDLTRPHEMSSSAMQALRRFHDDPHVREEFWADLDCPTRRLVDRALEPFERWWASRAFPPSVTNRRRGLLAGDFTITLEKEGVRLGVAGLCTSFLKIDDSGRAALSPHQLTVAAGGDAPGWVAAHDAVLLVTHDPAAQLTEADRRSFEELVAPTGRFVAHLVAHAHTSEAMVNDGLTLFAPSFFGNDPWTDARGRTRGFLAARCTLEEGTGVLEVWNRTWLGGRFGSSKGGPDVAKFLRAPALEREAQRPLAERAVMRQALAAAYPGPQGAGLMANQARLSPVPSFAGERSGIDAWHALVTESERTHRLDVVMKIARIDHPQDPKIANAHEMLSSSASKPAVDQAGNALFERLSDLQPEAFDAAVRLAGLIEGGSTSAPQPTRAMSAVHEAERRGVRALELLAFAIGQVTFASTDTGLSMAPAFVRPARVPTTTSLTRMLRVMFDIDRDFDAFVASAYHSTYRKFTSGMNRLHRIGMLLKDAEPEDVVAQVKRHAPDAFAKHRRVLDYEEREVRAPSRGR